MTTTVIDHGRWPLTAVLLIAVAALAAPAPVAAQDESDEPAEAQPAETEAAEAQPAAATATEPAASTEAQPTTRSRSRSRSERPFYLSFGMGPSIGLDSGTNAKLKLQQEAGYHFLPLGDHPGVFAGVTIAQSFINYSIFQFGGRVGVDFAILETDSFRLLVTPSIALGFGTYVVSSSVIGTEARTHFNLQFAGDVKAEILDGKFAIWVRPIGLDLFINGGSLERYDVLFGVQMNL